MSDEPLVSVIIPAFNSARWIGEAIASALAQTHRNLEVIVADNGSTDATREIATAAGERVRVIRAETRGPGAARNAALEVARGEFVQFLDADDLLEPWKIERQLAVLRRTGADLVWGPFTMYDEDPATGTFVRGVRRDPDLAGDLPLSLVNDGFLQIGCALYRRRSVVGALRFLPSAHCEDIDYNVRAALAGARFVRGEGDSGLLFRQHLSARASQDAELLIADANRRNVRLLKDWWQSRGELTQARRTGLVPPLLYAARVLARRDPARLRDVLAELRALDPGFERQLPAKLRLPSRLLGYERMERFARWYRALAAVVRRRRGATSSATRSGLPAGGVTR